MAVMQFLTAVLVPVEIFRAGQHKRGGVVEDYPVEMLDEVVESFDLAKHRPPLIFSHFLPSDIGDREAADSEYSFGVPEQVSRQDDTLFAYFDPAKLSGQFKAWVKSGNLSGKSAGFYPPDHSDNPTPGKWNLREVSVLGTKAPVIGNLTPLQAEFNFADTVIEFAAEASDDEFGIKKTMGSPPKTSGQGFAPKPRVSTSKKVTTGATMREFAKLAQAHMDATGKTIEELAEAVGITPAALQSKLSGAVEFAEGESAALTQALLFRPQPTAREIELERQLKEFAAEREKSRKAQLKEFAEDLASEAKGILLPGEVAGQVAVLEALMGATTTVEFAGEGNLSPLEAHKKFLAGLKPRIDYGELPPEKPPTSETVDFATPSGYSVDPERLALHNKAISYQAQHPGVDYMAAVKAVGGK